MAFNLEIPGYVENYLNCLHIPQSIRDWIADLIDEDGEIANLLPEFFTDPANRSYYGDLLRFSRTIMPPNENMLYTITFAINDGPAQYGVLRIPHAHFRAAPFNVA